MLRRSLVSVTIFAFLGSLAFAACTPPSDPNSDDDNKDTYSGPSDGGGTMDADGGGGTMDSATGGDDTTMPDGGGGACERSGQTKPHAGGTPTSDPLQNSAGLANVVDKIKSIKMNNGGSWPTNSSDEEKTVPLEQGEQIEITDAVVTATSFKTDNFDAGQQNFWLQDSEQAITVFLDKGEEIDCPIVRVGDRVSFTVTAVKSFSGIPQISAVDNYRRNKQATSDAVPVTNKTGEAISPDKFAEIVRVSGQITADQGSCGGDATCFELTHGTETIVYRAPGPVKPSVGDCVTYVGPVNLFPGPLADAQDKTVQLQPTNLDWAFTETPMNGDGGGTCEPADFYNGQIFTPEERK